MTTIEVNTIFLRGIKLSIIEDGLKNASFKSYHLSGNKVTIEGGITFKKQEEKMHSPNTYVYWTNKEAQRLIGVSRAPTNICDWCRREIKVVDGEKRAMGMPIGVPTTDGEISVVGTYDTWNCMYSEALREDSMPGELKCVLYRDTSSIVRHLFSTACPGETLRVAPHFSKLISNGGWMSDEEFESHTASISSLPSYKPVACVVLDQMRRV